jgi:hypothetical protein
MRKILLILCLAGAVRAAGVQVLTTDTLWDWRTAANPEISPDGRQKVHAGSGMKGLSCTPQFTTKAPRH